jgi:Uma2 family endonuclease
MNGLVLKDSVTRHMTDDEFLRFCQENPTLRIERNSDLEVTIMSPVSTLSGSHSSEIFGQLYLWNRQNSNGLVFDASVGFTLPDRSVLSPDASWMSRDKWNRLNQAERNRFASACPEFVIEVLSKSDDIEVLQRKMVSWIKHGASLAWLIDPWNATTYWYQTGSAEKVFNGFDKKILAVEPVRDFELDLSRLEI